MKKMTILNILFILVPFILFSQQLVKTSGEAQVELTETRSRQDVKKEAKELATVNALEKAFGRVIIQGNSTYISNINTGEKTETNSVFNMIANTSVKGEVIEVINEKYEDVKGYKVIDGKKIEVTEILCEITIRARELAEPLIDFTTYPLACTNIKCRTTSFIENDTLFLFFLSPISGYLSVYLDDGEYSQRLLPYKNMPVEYESGMPIMADREYVFFSKQPEHNYFEDKDFEEDVYELYSKSKKDINRLFIIFSKTLLNKPKLVNNIKIEQLTEPELDGGYTMPKALKSEDFQKWLNKCRSYRKNDMQVEIIDITITK
ncbi:MAG: hypothetical protein KAT38_08110 [Bacteroidales bacterium]|nr:hypothetical protein [Bacteroidales bacterium]